MPSIHSLYILANVSFMATEAMSDYGFSGGRLQYLNCDDGLLYVDSNIAI